MIPLKQLSGPCLHSRHLQLLALQIMSNFSQNQAAILLTPGNRANNDVNRWFQVAIIIKCLEAREYKAGALFLNTLECPADWYIEFFLEFHISYFAWDKR